MIDLEPHSTCVWRRERERDRTCVRACVVRIGRGATASAKGEAEGTHIFERDAPWTLGLARRPRVGGERGRDIGRSAFVHARRKAAFTTRRGDTVRADLVRLVLRARSKTRRGAKEKLVASYRIRSLT